MPPSDPPVPECELWRIRASVYALIAARGRPPSSAACAAALGLPAARLLHAYRELHARHALLLAPDGESIRMAPPFAGEATPFVVTANGVRYWANCAWDSLGIPAALHADATIAAPAADGGTVQLAVRDGRLVAGDELVHWALPFRRWYEDLGYT